MSLRQAFKAKFRSEKSPEGAAGGFSETRIQTNQESPNESLEDLRPDHSASPSVSLFQ